jgi:CheY-like chemotaxis protein/HPt (histidine-containing phosphotransfer) domain-containing protein
MNNYIFAARFSFNSETLVIKPEDSLEDLFGSKPIYKTLFKEWVVEELKNGSLVFIKNYEDYTFHFYLISIYGNQFRGVVVAVSNSEDTSFKVITDSEVKYKSEDSEGEKKLLSYLSHEIKTPLNAILGSVELIQKLDPTGEQKKYLKIIYSAGEAILSLMDDVLGVSRVSIANYEVNNSISNSEIEERVKDTRILLVEDIETNRVVAVNILKNYDICVECATNGAEALEMLSNSDYDLILMDISMPIMDGYEATKRIRNNFPTPKREVPILALTASALTDSRDKIFSAGMNGYISKPVKSYELLRAIESLTNTKFPDLNDNDINCADKVFVENDLLDLSYLKEISKSDTVFSAGIIGSFLGSFAEILSEIEKNFVADDLKRTREICHKFKPTLAYMGMKKVIPLMSKFHENLHNDGINKNGQLLILKKIIELTHKSATNLKEVYEKMRSANE